MPTWIPFRRRCRQLLKVISSLPTIRRRKPSSIILVSLGAIDQPLGGVEEPSCCSQPPLKRCQTDVAREAGTRAHHHRTPFESSFAKVRPSVRYIISLLFLFFPYSFPLLPPFNFQSPRSHHARPGQDHPGASSSHYNTASSHHQEQAALRHVRRRHHDDS